MKPCLVRFSNALVDSGQGVIVSPRLVLCALHGEFEVGNNFNIRVGEMTSIVDAIPQSVKVCKLEYQWFENGRKDIALLRLKDEEIDFEKYLGIDTREVRVKDSVNAVSLLLGSGGNYDYACQGTEVFMIDSGTALCRAKYYAEDGMSGSAIVTQLNSDGNVLIVGVHSASHDATKKAPDIKINNKKQKTADSDSISASLDSLGKNIHDHTSYSLVCIANKVPELMQTINDDLQSNNSNSSANNSNSI